MIWLYRFLLTLILPAILVWLIWQAWREKSTRFFSQRLGFSVSLEKAPIWFHAASVGEVNALWPLLQAIQVKSPQLSLLVTTNTITGATRLKQLSPTTEHRFLPLDFPWMVNHFLKKTHPKCLYLIETELWPNLFRSCHRRDLPISIINGRLSKKTLSAPKWIRQLYRESLQLTKEIMVRSTEDQQRFISLGAIPEKTINLGNLKYSLAPPIKVPPLIQCRRPYILLASSRKGEERIIADCWHGVPYDLRHQYLLVIAPRHPKRLKNILHDLGEYKVAIRSLDETIQESTEIYLADTLGEMSALMQQSEWVIMGGSFVSKGGQNLIEAVNAEKAVIVGPDMSNFAEETNALLKAKAAIQVNNIAELEKTITRLLSQPESLKEISARGAKFISQQHHILQNYLQRIVY